MTHHEMHRDTPQATLFADDAVAPARRSLPVIGEQKDIR